ncbi:M23 family metallopeptidase [Pseudomonas sp. NFIX28]|uniref:M23 family metallopeptidase n=1 Tax=Pseudomonas sp. NFIX28 TaxID=1566235 RepID=UPI00089ADFEB|nr:M23 family metallopeptidase [Pseudomonas sp. NFIX28]SDY62739.1 hydroxyethylthiazole kinase [Pseudomonas sp. NFIX28]
MLISPPFIPAAVANESDQDYINRAMIGGEPGNGAFPISHDMGWHGGIHLTAPQAGNEYLPVRAIADGTIAYVRQPSARNIEPTDPQNYRNGWTDNGCLVLKHETDIGDGVQASVVFYSIYMHLSSVTLANAQQGLRVYRKDKVGTAGSIYGEEHKMHFEIICSQEQISRLTGRSNAKLSTTSVGRADSCWGDMYFYIPQEVVFHAERPANATSSANSSPIVYRPAEAYFIRMNYSRGQCKLSTFNEDGILQGERAEEQDYEYNLYKHAADLYPRCTSAGYELLRFGRVLGTDTLQPVDAAHWREVTYPGGSGWVNLNGPTVTIYSDADFPHWQGWILVDDDTNSDGRCQSRMVMDLLGIASVPVTPEERENCRSILDQAEMCKRIRRLICKFPTEWKKGNFSERFNWLTSGDAPIVSAEVYKRLKAHYEALAFWEDADLDGIDAEHWHLPPKEFVALFRRCGWLSLNEMKQLIPTVHPNTPPTAISNASVTLALTDAASGNRNAYRPSGLHLSLNKMMRKYNFSTAERMSALFSQMLTETDLMKTTREYGNANYYTRAYEGRCNVTIQRVVVEWGAGISNLSPLGNCSPGDGERFIGRGVIQMTGRELYVKYGNYRGMDFVTGTNYLNVSDVADNACDSAGYYWVKEDLRDRNAAGQWVLRRVKNIHRDADALSSTELSTAAGEAAADAKILTLTRQINRAAFHIIWRRAFFKHSYYVLSELVTLPPSSYHRRQL